MKIEQVSEHIWTLQDRLLPLPLRIWLAVDDSGVTLIDAGLAFMARPILSFVERLGAGRLHRILLTHGHPDHTGAVPRLVAATAVPVYAHRLEIPYVQGDKPYPGRRRAQANLAPGLVEPLPEDANGKLQPLAGLTPHLTPGHSPGHVAYYHPIDQVLLAGDLFTSRRGRLRRPMAMFTSDMATAIQSGPRIVTELQPLRLEVAHGGPVFNPAEQIAEYA